MTYLLLSTKIRTICNRMGLDFSTVTFRIMLQEITGTFNAQADPTCKQIDIPMNLIKFMAWNEGSGQYYKTEGLFDGILAHELAHIFHQHGRLSTIEKELEADRTGTLCLQFPKNMMGLNILGLGHALLENIPFQGNVHLSWKNRFFMTCVITSSLIKRHPSLGSLGNCATDGHQNYNIHNALKVLRETEYPEKYPLEERLYGLKAKYLDPQDCKIICSLIYEKLLSCCTQCIEIPEDFDDLNGNYDLFETSHPGPQRRNAAIRQIIDDQRNQHSC